MVITQKFKRCLGIFPPSFNTINYPPFFPSFSYFIKKKKKALLLSKKKITQFFTCSLPHYFYSFFYTLKFKGYRFPLFFLSILINKVCSSHIVPCRVLPLAFSLLFFILFFFLYIQDKISILI